MAKSKRAARKPGVYCIRTKVSNRCVRKYRDGRNMFINSHNIECPSACRKSSKKKSK